MRDKGADKHIEYDYLGLHAFDCAMYDAGMSDSSWKQQVPRPVCDDSPGLVDLYWKAWNLAYDHIKEEPGLPQTPYMDEAHWEDTIWIWDTCFMVLFCKYAPSVFPGVESLNNFYVPLHDGAHEAGEFPLNIQHPDNPPLFAWVEYENFLFTDDADHVTRLLKEKRYLQRHFEWFNTVETGWQFHSRAEEHNPSSPVRLKQHPKGFFWGGVQSGMDNTPRQSGLWVDAIAQQALSALYISRLAAKIGDEEMEKEWLAEYSLIKDIINAHYWNEDDGIYYDIHPETLEHLKVKTPASFWPMLAEVCDAEQAGKLLQHALDPNSFGGDNPWPSVSPDHPDFAPEDGDYWQGGVWLPTAYMATKALERYGFHDAASLNAEKLLQQMRRTFTDFEPHTIWEAYSPTRDRPATYKDSDSIVRPDFCGWSALGPISLFIENIIGINSIDAQMREVNWRLCRQSRHGIEGLTFDDVSTNIIYDGEGKVVVESNRPYQLKINGAVHSIPAAGKVIQVDPC